MKKTIKTKRKGRRVVVDPTVGELGRLIMAADAARGGCTVLLIPIQIPPGNDLVYKVVYGFWTTTRVFTTYKQLTKFLKEIAK